MINNLFKHRAEDIFFYSPYNFVREIAPSVLIELEKKKIEDWENSENNYTESFEFSDGTVAFYLKRLPWDTDFFKIRTIKLTYVLFNCSFENLQIACEELISKLRNAGFQYCFIDIPAEDTKLIQALGSAGFKLIETRLTYFHPSPASHTFQRFKVRKGTPADIPNLRRVASLMRNKYDRFHADTIFEPEIADAFLAKYIEEALKGFCDVVLVPDEPGISADSFLTANYNKAEWQKTGIPISKMVLSAVSSETNKGWYVKLISEMTYHLVEEGAQVIFMNTQATNRAVFRTWEKLGYQLGCTTHLLSITI